MAGHVRISQDLVLKLIHKHPDYIGFLASYEIDAHQDSVKSVNSYARLWRVNRSVVRRLIALREAHRDDVLNRIERDSQATGTRQESDNGATTKPKQKRGVGSRSRQESDNGATSKRQERDTNSSSVSVAVSESEDKSQNLKAAEYLAAKILGRIEHAKVPSDLSSWATDIDRMIRIDGVTLSEVRLVIDWVFDESEFWPKNILSASKLRKQFPRLWAEASPTSPDRPIVAPKTKRMLEAAKRVSERGKRRANQGTYEVVPGHRPNR